MNANQTQRYLHTPSQPAPWRPLYSAQNSNTRRGSPGAGGVSGGPLGAVSPAQQGRSSLGGAAVWSSAWNGWINRTVAGGSTELGREFGPHRQGELSSGPDGAGRGRGPAITRPQPSHGSERFAPYTRLCPQDSSVDARSSWGPIPTAARSRHTHCRTGL